MICIRWRRLILLIVVVICLSFVPMSESLAEPTYRKVADNGTAIPNGTGNFTSFAEFSSGAPSIDDGMTAFYAAGTSNQEGVFLDSSGTLTRIVDRNTTYPDGDGIGNFTNINAGISLSGGRAKFNGSGNVGQGGIFTGDGASIDVLVDTATQHPNGLGNYGIFGNTALDGTQGVFFGGNNSDTGYYLRSVLGGTITPVAERLDIMPGSTSDQFFGFGLPDLEDGEVVFTGRGGSTLARRGVYRYSGGALSVLYDTSTPIPGGTDNFVEFASVRLSNGKVLFYGEGDTEQGFYTDVGGSLQVVADLNTPAPGGATFDQDGFVYSSLDGTDIAFWSFLVGGGSGIYTNLSGSLDKLIATGDTLDGKLVNDLDFGPEGLSGREVAFRAVFADGSTGIYVASFDEANLPGDFNNDGNVDAADYVNRRKSNGMTGDYEIWRANFGAPANASSQLQTVPEPATILVFVSGVAVLFCCRTPRLRLNGLPA